MVAFEALTNSSHRPVVCDSERFPAGYESELGSGQDNLRFSVFGRVRSSTHVSIERLAISTRLRSRPERLSLVAITCLSLAMVASVPQDTPCKAIVED
jgi:hypothetical protein